MTDYTHITPQMMNGDCPVCGGSWKGASFFYMFRRYDLDYVENERQRIRTENAASDSPRSEAELERLFPQATPEAVIRQLVAERYVLPNQSLLMQTEDGRNYQCPHCGTTFDCPTQTEKSDTQT